MTMTQMPEAPGRNFGVKWTLGDATAVKAALQVRAEQLRQEARRSGAGRSGDAEQLERIIRRDFG